MPPRMMPDPILRLIPMQCPRCEEVTKVQAVASGRSRDPRRLLLVTGECNECRSSLRRAIRFHDFLNQEEP